MSLYTCNFCPVCDFMGDLVVVKDPSTEALFLYCNDCGCACPLPPARHQVDQLKPPETYAPDGFVLPTDKEIANARRLVGGLFRSKTRVIIGKSS